MDEVQQVEAAEGEQQAPQRGGVVASQQAAKEEPHAEEHEGIGAEPFPSQGSAERQEAVQQQMPRMVRSALSFAGEVKARVKLRHPVEGLAASQLCGEERPHGQVVGAEVVAGIDPAGKERSGQSGEQEQPGKETPGGELPLETLGRGRGRGFKFARHSSTDDTGK